MSDGSKIAWTDATWPVVEGCDYVSEGCKNCYAARFVHRHAAHPNAKISLPVKGLTKNSGHGPRWTGKVVCREDRLDDPAGWKKPRKVFVPSLGDIFHDDVPDEFLLKIFQAMHRAKQHTYQVLTKRPDRMAEFARTLCLDEATDTLYLNRHSGRPYLPHAKHIWLGVSAENQKRADQRLPKLMETPCAVRFVSLEPLLERISIVPWLASPYQRLRFKSEAPETLSRARLDWVIVGGESGPKAREFHLTWAAYLGGQCEEAGVAFFMKQVGSNAWLSPTSQLKTLDYGGATPQEWPATLRVQQFPDGHGTNNPHFIEV